MIEAGKVDSEGVGCTEPVVHGSGEGESAVGIHPARGPSGELPPFIAKLDLHRSPPSEPSTCS